MDYPGVFPGQSWLAPLPLEWTKHRPLYTLKQRVKPRTLLLSVLGLAAWQGALPGQPVWSRLQECFWELESGGGWTLSFQTFACSSINNNPCRFFFSENGLFILVLKGDGRALQGSPSLSLTLSSWA